MYCVDEEGFRAHKGCGKTLSSNNHHCQMALKNAWSTLSGPSPAESSRHTSPIDTASNTPTRQPMSRIPVSKLSRENPTYDGIMSINPEPQPDDPPRPTVAPRSASFDVVADGDEDQKPAEDLSFVQLGDMKSALDRLMADVAGEARAPPDGHIAGLRIEAVTEGVKARRHSLPDTSDVEMPEAGPSTAAGDQEEYSAKDSEEVHMHIELPSMGPDTLLNTSFLSPGESNEPARPTSPRPPITKDAIKTREELIKAKKREARRRAEDLDDDSYDDAGPSKDYFMPRRLLPTRRRSLSTGDADDLSRSTAMRRRSTIVSDGGMLDGVPIEDEEEDALGDSIDRELNKMGRTVCSVPFIVSRARADLIV